MGSNILHWTNCFQKMIKNTNNNLNWILSISMNLKIYSEAEESQALTRKTISKTTINFRQWSPPFSKMNMIAIKFRTKTKSLKISRSRLRTRCKAYKRRCWPGIWLRRKSLTPSPPSTPPSSKPWIRSQRHHTRISTERQTTPPPKSTPSRLPRDSTNSIRALEGRPPITSRTTHPIEISRPKILRSKMVDKI